MSYPQGNSSESPMLFQDECCDLYGEYCYPCNITASEVVREEKGTQQKSSSNRNND